MGLLGLLKSGGSHRRNQLGFTLAEIMIVFAIIGLITAGLLGTSFISSRKSARDTYGRNQMKQLSVAFETYYNDHGRYPAASSGRIQACGAGGSSVCNWGSDFTDQNDTVYMAELPVPKYGNFVYRVNATGQAWQLYILLENQDQKDLDRNSDGQYTPAGDGYTFVDCDTSSGSVNYCNYGISSGNVTPATNPLN